MGGKVRERRWAEGLDKMMKVLGMAGVALVLSEPALAQDAQVVRAPSPATAPIDPNQRNADCLVALGSDESPEPMTIAAKSYFEGRVNSIEDAELRQSVMISAEEAVRPNRNRAEIASTCVLLHQVLKLQGERLQPAEPAISPEPLKGLAADTSFDRNIWQVAPRAEFPATAAANGITEGGAIVECTVDADHRPRECTVVSENPEGFGFGQAAVHGVERGVLRPETPRHPQTGIIRQPVHFRLEN